MLDGWLVLLHTKNMQLRPTMPGSGDSTAPPQLDLFKLSGSACNWPAFLSPALLALCLMGSPAARAAYLHQDATYITYTDFGQNCGRYVAGASNALLDYIRRQEGGIVITYTGGQPGCALPLSQGMIDFDSMSDSGNVTALGVNTVVSAYHVYTDSNLKSRFNPTFTADKLGSSYAVRYATVQIATPMQADGKTPADFCMGRLNKVVTDVRTTTLAADSFAAAPLVYRAGSGVSYRMDAEGTPTWLCNDIYTIGSINGIVGYGVDSSYSPDIRVVQTVADWSASGISVSNPLPSMGATYDSGSPIWIYNSATRRYEYLAAMQGIDPEKNLSQWLGPTAAWARPQMAAYDRTVATTGNATLQVSAVSAEGKGTVTGGAATVEFKGVAEGKHTWKALNEVMDSNTWYTYANAYMNGYGGDTSYLAETSNLLFLASDSQGGSSTISIQLEDTVDLGVGYAEFTKATPQSAEADFIISSPGDGTATFNHAGYVVNAGVNVHVQLTNSADYAREWRKIGAGNLYIEGNGNNYIGLNLGGSGSTYLNRTGGYAAYNVLANTGATVVLNDVDQIARDFTFGNGGGVLDFNGCSMVWNNSAAVEDTGFTIHALTEEAVIANNGSGTSILTITDAGSSFLGSFRDSSTGALLVAYNGTGSLDWHGIATDLSHHEDSGIVVRGGSLVLSGTHTVHGQGSATGKSTDRYTNADDWHYADATANVTVEEGGRFELGSHARLIGNVTVEAGGTFVMHEGVLRGGEYIEGGQRLQSTAAISEFYGLKGKVLLVENAAMLADISGEATVATEYAHSISGAGSLTKTGEGTLRLTGNISCTGGITIQAGTLDLATSVNLSTVSSIATTSATIQAREDADSALLEMVSVTAGIIAGSDRRASLADELYIESTADLMLKNMTITADNEIHVGSNAITLNQVTINLSTAKYELVGSDYYFQLHDLINCDLVMDDVTFDASALKLPSGFNPAVNGIGIDFGDDVTIDPQTAKNLTLLMGDDRSQTLSIDAQGRPVFTKLVPTPEPTTGALGLLSLALLAARR